MSVSCANPNSTLVVISGVAGALGAALGLEAAFAGYSVKGLYHRTLPGEDLTKHPRVSLESLDIASDQFVLANAERFDRVVLFHTAAAAFVPTAINEVNSEQAAANWATAVTGARNLVTHTIFNLRRTHRIEIYLITSSILADPFRLPAMFDYVMAKAGLKIYCDFLKANAGKSVMVYEVCPRYFASQFNKDWPEPVKAALASAGTDDPRCLAKSLIAQLAKSSIQRSETGSENE